jgi:predicted ATPase/DNA-binding CsgD family transcriptional regulator
VTLTGIGGVGKTRLALQVAHQVRRSFPDDAWWVDLGALDQPMLVPATVEAGLGIQASSSRPPLDVLTEYLAGKHLLLVLDNCEQVVDACAVLVDALLRTAPDLRVLTTSRQPLGLSGEHIVVVPPFPVPDHVPDGALNRLATNDAVNLFVSRAASVVADFQLDSDNASAVAAVCRRVDGLPLAIELAAAKLRAFSVDQVLARLDERFQLLTGGSRAALPRQQTLHGLIDWSYQLCTADEQLLWTRVSVFAGSFDLDAAEVVCGDDRLPPSTLLDALAGLVDKSVLLRNEHPSGVRYRLLESVRDFGRARLDDDIPLRRRHLDHYYRLMGRACDGLFSAEGPFWLGRIRSEHANLRAARSFSLSEAGEPDDGLELAALLWFAWRELGLFSEGRWWLDQLIATSNEPTPSRARALWATGALAVLQGDVDVARVVLAESRCIAELTGDELSWAFAELFSGQLAQIEGQLDTAVRLLEHAVDRLKALADPLGVAVALIRLTNAASAMGDGDRAIRLGLELRDLCSAHSATLLTPSANALLAIEYWRQGDAESAVDEARKSAREYWTKGDLLGAALAFEVLAWAAAGRGDARKAVQILGAVDTVWRSAGAALFGYPHLMRHHDECVSACEHKLGEESFSRAWQDGARLGLRDVAEETLQLRSDAARTLPDESWTPLTRREREVALLVGQGMTNKEIAGALVISQRTAEAHVEHVLVKLGFASRGQIAAWVSARDTDSRGAPD